MTRPEAAEYLRVSVDTIDRYARDGKIKKYTVAGTRSIRFKAAELDALMEPEIDDDLEIDQETERINQEFREEAAWAQGRAPTPDNPRCPIPRCAGPVSCDHVWCSDCNNWVKDSGTGPKCGHWSYGPGSAAA